VAFTAEVTPETSTGLITFKSDGAPFGTATLNGGKASLSTSALAVGHHLTTAVYSGDSTHGDSTSAELAVEVLGAPKPESWVPLGGPDSSPQQVQYLTFAIAPDGTPYLAYRDLAHEAKASVMRFTDSAWKGVGSFGFSADAIAYPSLAFAKDGTPYLAYTEAGERSGAGGWAYDRIAVMRFRDGVWSPVPGAGLSAAKGKDLFLSFAPDGSLHLAYTDLSNERKATVMRFAADDWRPVGRAGFSKDETRYNSLAFDRNGTPYVAFFEKHSGGTVMRYTASDGWKSVGSIGSADALCQFPFLAVAADGTLFASCYHSDSTTKVNWHSVWRYDGLWVDTGPGPALPARDDAVSLGLAPDGTPYLAFSDRDRGGKLTVMRLREGTWSAVGRLGISSGTASLCDGCLAFGPRK
jgi:hypothetical protein